MKKKRKYSRTVRAAGVTRRIIFPFALDEDEYEFLSRYARHIQVKIGPYLRAKAFPPKWKMMLSDLRCIQGANVK